VEKGVNLEDLKKQIVGDSKREKTSAERKKVLKEIDTSVDEIIERVREKYEQEGAYIREDDLSDAEIDVNKLLTPEITVSGSPEDLAEHENAIIRAIGQLYLRFSGLFDRLLHMFTDSSALKRLDWDLYAANMPFTGAQYAAFLAVLSVILGVVSFVLSIPLFVRYPSLVAALAPIAIGIMVFALTFIIGLRYPKSRAAARSRAAERYLPFALRHLAVEIRAGAGLYQAMRAVAEADYGVLSEEFRRVLKEIDEGKSTEAALSNFAARMYSKGIRRAVSTLLRAVRIGGNLSEPIMELAKDVSFEQRMKVAAFGEKLNFFSVLFMFGAVVFPVMLAMIATIGNAPTGGNLLAAFRLPTPLLAVIYVVAFPGFLLLFLWFIRMLDPMR